MVYLYTYIRLIFMLHVGKYTSPMDPMGHHSQSFAAIFSDPINQNLAKHLRGAKIAWHSPKKITWRMAIVSSSHNPHFFSATNHISEGFGINLTGHLVHQVGVGGFPLLLGPRCFAAPWLSPPSAWPNGWKVQIQWNDRRPRFRLGVPGCSECIYPPGN